MIRIKSQEELEQYLQDDKNRYYFDDDVLLQCSIITSRSLVTAKSLCIEAGGYIKVRGCIEAGGYIKVRNIDKTSTVLAQVLGGHASPQTMAKGHSQRAAVLGRSQGYSNTRGDSKNMRMGGVALDSARTVGMFLWP